MFKESQFILMSLFHFLVKQFNLLEYIWLFRNNLFFLFSQVQRPGIRARRVLLENFTLLLKNILTLTQPN